MGWKSVTKESSSNYLSHSQISMYQRCPKQYEYRYIKGLKRAPNSNLIVGIAGHKGVETNYQHKFKKKKQANKNVVMDAYSKHFDGMKSGVDFEGKNPGVVKDRGYAMSKVHYETIAPSVQPTMKPELKFDMMLPGMKKKIIGYIDVVATVGKAINVVLDTKFTGRKFDQFKVDIDQQLTTYAYAIKNLVGKAPKLMGIDAIIGNSKGVTPQRVTTRRSLEELKQFEETAKSVEKGIETGIFYPTNNFMTCGWCGYNDICQSAAVKNRAATRGY